MSQALSPEILDDWTCALYLEVPGPNVVKLQGYFEIYEEFGIVRTLDIRRSLICILIARSLYSECRAMLESIQRETGWRAASRPADMNAEHFLGYWRKESHAATIS